MSKEQLDTCQYSCNDIFEWRDFSRLAPIFLCRVQIRKCYRFVIELLELVMNNQLPLSSITVIVSLIYRLIVVCLLGFGDSAESTLQSKILNPEYQQLLIHIALSWPADMRAFFEVNIAINNLSVTLSLITQ